MKLSIITINLNHAAGLQETLRSVHQQTSKEFEHILIDGDSTDGSVELIRSFADISPGYHTPRLNQRSSPITYWISEPDKGIFNAMNKGLRMACGDYVHFLNSGDWLADEQVVEKMLVALDPETDILVGEMISVRPDGKARYNKNKNYVGLSTFYGGTIQHTSAYIRRSLFETYGFYDESLKIVADWKWYLIAAGLNNARVQFADIYVSCFDTTGVSSTYLDLDKAERRQVLEDVIPCPILVDYDRFYFYMVQIERMKRSKWLYALFWFSERCLFKIEKWKSRYFGWKKHYSNL